MYAIFGCFLALETRSLLIKGERGIFDGGPGQGWCWDGMLGILLNGSRYYYNKGTRTSKWRIPDEVKLAREKDIISHASDFGSIPVVKTSSPGVDGSLLSAHVEMKNSSEPSSPTVANSEKIGIAVTLGNSVSPPVSETTSAQDAVVYGDGFSLENREKDAALTEIGGATPSNEKTVELGPLVYESKAEAKSAFKTLLQSANIGSDFTWDQAMRAVINDWRYGALKSIGERKQAFNEYLSQKKKLEAKERHVKQKKAREDFRIMLEASSQWRKVQDRLETDERCSRLEKINCLEIFQEYIRDLESEEGEQRKLWMIKDFAAYLVVSSNTSGSTAKDLFTDVMDELEKQVLRRSLGVQILSRVYRQGCLRVQLVSLLCFGRPSHLDRQKAFRAFGLGNAHHGNGGGGSVMVEWLLVASVADGGGKGGDTSVVMVSKECVEVDDVLVVVNDAWKLMMC
ncbi:hypothetical protein T459_31566 [Capsicum annuum]|uniref:FF domain-containing protein n=1 Tax=Capsicum annuum TaxID=4072 RepID=A0A2G2YC59_CAPAN|nr:hypothetical protein T459_31566 [Capsicum annuum]